jgi:type IX secretion system PorP/SprF family membrane protein
MVSAQQAPQFTQFMFNNLIVNPAYAGADKVGTINFLNRSQWSGVDGAPSTLAFSAHMPTRNIGLGISLVHDRIGVHKNIAVRTNYAYHIRLNENTTLSMGLQAGLINLRSDYPSLAASAGDPKALNTINEMFFDFGAGIHLQSSRLQIGFSSPSIFANNIHINDTVNVVFKNTTMYAYLRYRFSMNQDIDLEPGILIKYFQHVPLAVDVNAMLTYRKVIGAGLAYRHKESIDAFMRLQLTYQLQLAYAYDYPIHLASRLSSSSHEIMIQYQFRKQAKNISSPR